MSNPSKSLWPQIRTEIKLVILILVNPITVISNDKLWIKYSGVIEASIHNHFGSYYHQSDSDFFVVEEAKLRI